MHDHSFAKRFTYSLTCTYNNKTRTAYTIVAQRMRVQTHAKTDMDTDHPRGDFEPSWLITANQGSVTTTTELRVLALHTLVAIINTMARLLVEGEIIVPKK
jgi:hypothetical protein